MAWWHQSELQGHGDRQASVRDDSSGLPWLRGQLAAHSFASPNTASWRVGCLLFIWPSRHPQLLLQSSIHRTGGVCQQKAWLSFGNAQLLSQTCRKGTHPSSLTHHWNLLFKSKEPMHGYTRALPTRPHWQVKQWPSTSSGLTGVEREKKSPASPGMNVLLPTEWRSQATRFWCNLKKPAAGVVTWLFSRQRRH